MEIEVKREVNSEIALPDITDSIYYGVAHGNKIKKEFSFSEPNSRGFMEQAVGSTATGTNLALMMEDEVKPEITLAAIIDSKSDVPHVNEMKKEFLPIESHSHGDFVHHPVEKFEDTSIQSSNLQIKSTVLDLKCLIKCDNGNIYIKHELLVYEELHIKNEEVQENYLDQTVEESTRLKHLYCGI